MPKVQTTKPTYNFKNIWRNYFNYSPKFATKGILHSVDRNANIALNKKVDSIIKPILKNEGFKVIHLGEDLSRFYTPVNKQKSKESLEIPYINKYYKQRCKEIQKDIEEYGEEDVWDTNITEIGIDTVTCIGKYKGIGDSSTLYYFVLVIGGHDEEDLENTTVAVEVITPLEKGEQFFLDEVKKAVSKLDVWKFNGKVIKVNKCSKAVTGSAESKVFAYKGQVITASSKQEAIQKIVASGNFVGVQKFTKAELKKAWDELVKNVENDPENKKFPPDNGYDIRNGYSTGEDKDICGKDGHDWSISFDYEDVLKEISRITEVITYGDLEVYWNSNKQNMAEPDNHGIIIEDGKIQQVY